MADLPPDAALRIARFCWPNEPWMMSENMRLAFGRITGRAWYPDRIDDLADAERVIVERGLGERYGEALIEEIDGIYTERQTLEAMFAIIRTAPLDAILRALFAVVEEQEKKR